MTAEKIREGLLELRDEEYKAFHSKLMPTVDPGKIIGIRTPVLRKRAKELLKEGDNAAFLADLPHKYYEEDNFHGFMIEGIKDFDECLKAVKELVPYIDNWATCDMLRPKALKKEPEKLLEFISSLLESEKVYSVRYGIGLLLSFYLDESFHPSQLERVSEIVSDEYYINMMIAWYFATALAKQYEEAVVYLERKLLPKWVHNKTIQKAVESYRISDETKKYLKKLKIR